MYEVAVYFYSSYFSLRKDLEAFEGFLKKLAKFVSGKTNKGLVIIGDSFYRPYYQYQFCNYVTS